MTDTNRGRRVNRNRIQTRGFSNLETEKLYRLFGTCERQNLRGAGKLYWTGRQCGGCSFFAEFNHDYGLCCNSRSPHWLETVFEHYSCLNLVHEGWGPHSFTGNRENHCRCGGSAPADEPKRQLPGNIRKKGVRRRVV